MVQKRSESFEKREHCASSGQYGADGRKVPESNPIRRSNATTPEGLSPPRMVKCAAEDGSPVHLSPPLKASPVHIAETRDSSSRETTSPDLSDRPSRRSPLVRPEETRAVKPEASPPEASPSDRPSRERRPSRDRRLSREVVRSAATRATHDTPIAAATPRRAELEGQLAAAKAMALKARRANDTPLALQKMRECKQIQADIKDEIAFPRAASVCLRSRLQPPAPPATRKPIAREAHSPEVCSTIDDDDDKPMPEERPRWMSMFLSKPAPRLPQSHDCSTGGSRTNTSVPASTGGCSDELMPKAPQPNAPQQLMRDAVFIASTVRSLPHACAPSMLRPTHAPPCLASFKLPRVTSCDADSAGA